MIRGRHKCRATRLGAQVVSSPTRKMSWPPKTKHQTKHQTSSICKGSFDSFFEESLGLSHSLVRPDRYDRKAVTEQLRYGGVLQA